MILNDIWDTRSFSRRSRSCRRTNTRSGVGVGKAPVIGRIVAGRGEKARRWYVLPWFHLYSLPRMMPLCSLSPARIKARLFVWHWVYEAMKFALTYQSTREALAQRCKAAWSCVRSMETGVERRGRWIQERIGTRIHSWYTFTNSLRNRRFEKRQQCFTPTDSSVVGIRGRYLNGPCVLLRLRLTFDVWCQTGSVEGTFSKHEGLYLMQPVFFVQIRPPYCRNNRKRQEQPTVPGPTGHHSRGGKHELQCIFEAFSLSFQKQLSLIV